jgi:hypothetical protein
MTRISIKKPYETRENCALCYPSPKDQPEKGRYCGVTRFEGRLFWVRVEIRGDETVAVELSPK